MEWIAAAIIVGILLIKFPRPTFLTLAGLVALSVVAAGVFAWIEDADRRDQSRVSAAATIDLIDCPELRAPIRLTIANNGERTIERTRAQVSGFTQERSTAIIQTDSVTDDLIIRPGQVSSICLPMNWSSGEAFSPESLEKMRALRWEVTSKYFTFE